MTDRSSSNADVPIVLDVNNINVGEGHLGGYIRSSAQRAASGIDVRNGDPLTWTPGLWRWLVSALNVRSMIDVGCGEGHSAGYFQSLGCDVLGVDGSRLAEIDSQIPGHHVRHDYASGPYHPGRCFDMVWCCEFVEHVEARYVENFLQTFSCASRYIVMTHARPGQPGWHHVNCQEQSYWEARLAKLGFEVNEALTSQSRWVASGGHFANTGLIFCRLDRKDRQ